MSKFNDTVELFAKEYFGSEIGNTVLEESVDQQTVMLEHLEQRIEVLELAVEDYDKDEIINFALDMYKVLKEHKNTHLMGVLDKMVEEHLKNIVS